MSRHGLTAQRLREVLNYDAETGIFTWAAPRPKVRAGGVAGGVPCHGYTAIMVDRRRYGAHRLAWLHVHGEWPLNDIDHINGVRNDNRICNLRKATRAQNMQNQREASSNNACGLLGASPKRGRWRAQIMVSGKVKHLGTFDAPELAHAAYLEAKAQLHPFQTLSTT